MNWFRKQLTIGDLLSIDDQRVDRSKKLSVDYIETINIVKSMTWIDKLKNLFKRGPKLIYYKVVRYKVKSDSGNSYTVLIKVSPNFDEMRFYKNKVEVFCTCPDFKYRAAYDLNKTDNLYKIKSTINHLGIAIEQPPTRISTTPCCKHIYACMIHLKTNLKRLNLIY